jgi:DNA-binding transcriptional MocR family regulator
MEALVQGQFAQNGLVHLLNAWSDGDGPLYRRLADALRSAIARGDLSVDQLLPPERVLARKLALSRSTVVAAYEVLRDEGLLERRQGSGTRVRSTPAPTQRAPGPSIALSRNTLFRRMTDGPHGTIDLTGAYFVEPGGVPDEVLRDIHLEIAQLVETSGYSPLGHMPLREAIARHLSGHGVPTSAEQVLVTSGAQQAIYLAAWLFLRPGDTVLVENPTYPGALDAFTAVGARADGVPTRRQGVDIEALTEHIRRLSPRLAYVIPTYQNPVGGVLPEHARRTLAAVVDKYQVVLVEDDSLSGLGIQREPPVPVAAYAPRAPILTIGSFSKLFWPGLRVGWIRAPEPVVAQLGRLKAVADLGGSLPAQAIAARLLPSHDEIRRQRAPIIARRLELAVSLLQTCLPDWTWDRPQGGLCLWVRIPYGSAAEYAQLALRNGVSIVAGSVASPDGSFGDYLRLPFGHRPETLEEGIRRLAATWEAYAPAPDGGSRSERLAVVV